MNCSVVTVGILGATTVILTLNSYVGDPIEVIFTILFIIILIIMTILIVIIILTIRACLHINNIIMSAKFRGGF